MNLTRSSGILLHPTSLPETPGIGTIGRQAFKFVDWLAAARQSLWQILPLGPTGYGDSPYASFSTFAGNPLMIDLDDLVERGWAEKQAVSPPAYIKCSGPVDFGSVVWWKMPVLKQAASFFLDAATDADRVAYEGRPRQKKNLVLCGVIIGRSLLLPMMIRRYPDGTQNMCMMWKFKK